MKKSVLRFLSVLLCLVLGLEYFACTVFADSSNGESGGSTTNNAQNWYYRFGQWGWRVSLYVAKDFGWEEEQYLSLSLTDDYYFCGYVNIANFDVPQNVLAGNKNKIRYIQNSAVELSQDTVWYKYANCPPIPLVSKRNNVYFDDINEVNKFFLNNNLILKLLKDMASQKGYDSAFDLIKDKSFTYHYVDNAGKHWYQTRTGAEWGETRILPYDSRFNSVPWVIVYEPMALVYDGSGTAQAFLTATEFALTQGKKYNWLWVGTENSATVQHGGKTFVTGGLPGCAMQSLAFQALPASVTLRDSWFGYETSPLGKEEVWTTSNIRSYGGWGMGFLSAARSLEISYVDPDTGYAPGKEAISSFVVKNNASRGLVPADDVRLHLNVTCNGASVYTAVSDPVTVPGGEDTYVWFRWTVPETVTGDLRLKVDYTLADGLILQPDDSGEPKEGAAELPGTVLVNARLPQNTDTAPSHTPEPVFESTPGDFYLTNIEEITRNVTWHTWTWDGSAFHKQEYTASLSGTVTLTPDTDVKSAYQVGNVWVMHSGYGFTVDARCRVSLTRKTDGGAAQNVGVTDELTGAERAKFLFPEFKWSTDVNKYEWAEYVTATSSGNVLEGQYVLPENPDARNKRVHHTTLWFPDGEQIYRVAVEWDACWTPGGTLRGRTVSDGITIDGDLYDDWYVTH